MFPAAWPTRHRPIRKRSVYGLISGCLQGRVAVHDGGMDFDAEPGPHVVAGSSVVRMGKAPHYGGPGKIENARLRTARALELRLAGLKYGEIANALGYASGQGAHNAVTRAMRQETAQSEEHREQLRALQLARTERMLRAIWPNVIAGDLFAIDRALKILDRQARLLGLDAPTQVAVTEQSRDELMLLLSDLEQALLSDDAG